MQSEVVYPYFKLLDQELGSKLGFRVTEGTLLVVQRQTGGAAIGMLLPAAYDYSLNWTKTYPELQRALGGASDLSFKVIGAGSYVHAITQALLRDRHEVKNSVCHPAGIEVIFLPGEGRIRICKLTAPEAAGERSDPIRVLVVDDSKTIRDLLKKILGADPAIEVVGSAERPSEVEALIQTTKPDVITLDIHMPEMNGVELLKLLLPKYPIPTIMISSLSLEEGSFVLDALENGAVDYIQKPTFNQISVTATQIIEKVKAAVNARVIIGRKAALAPSPRLPGSPLDQSQLLVIGSSTGGTEALKQILTQLPSDIPPILIVQHIPAIFSKSFADRMNELCPFEVLEAKDGDAVLPNRVLIAAGGTQMRVTGARGKLIVRVDGGPSEQRHKPSVDVLFTSAAALKNQRTIGVILTGMGSDGAKGLLQLRKAGAHTLAQDEASCVVFGMPKEAIKLGAAERISPLSEIPQALTAWLTRYSKKTA